jgi:hypothetical protein
VGGGWWVVCKPILVFSFDFGQAEQLMTFLQSHQVVIKEKLTLFIFSEGGIVRRGCSTKMPMFHVECENHVSGTRNEKFCYCSYELCNRQDRIAKSFTVIAAQAAALVALNQLFWTGV